MRQVGRLQSFTESAMAYLCHSDVHSALQCFTHVMMRTWPVSSVCSLFTALHLAAGLLPTLSPAGSMERSGSVPLGPLSMGSGPLPSLKEEDFEVGVKPLLDTRVAVSAHRLLMLIEGPPSVSDGQSTPL